MTVKNMAYDHPSYITRQTVNIGVNVAGASTSPVNKFVAFTNMILYSVTASSLIAGSSTSTYTLNNGTATVTAVNADSFTVRRYTAQSGTGLTTATFGTFVVAPYNGTATGTQTLTAGVVNRYQISGTATATTGVAQSAISTVDGGIVLQQGDIIDILRGTDASAVTGFALEIGIQPLANVSN